MTNTIKLSALALFLAFTSCKNDKNQKENISETTEKITITHSLGTAEIIKNPTRVVALDFASLETLDELGIKTIGMPKGNKSSHLQKYIDDTSVVDLGSLMEINYEKLSELNPDVIFISARLQKAYPEISKIAPTVYTEIDYKDYKNSIRKNFEIFGEIFDKKEEIDNALKNIEGKITQVNEKVKDSDKKALIILHNNGKYSAYGKGSRFGIIHDVLGLKEAVENLETARHGQAVSNEFIQQANPDYLFIIDRSAVVDKNATNKAEIENKLIQQTNAYKNGKVIYLDPEIWYLAGGGITSINKMIDEVSNNL